MAPGGSSWQTQSQSIIFSAQLSHPRNWTEDEDEEQMETEWGRRKDHAVLVEARAAVQGRGSPLHWALVTVLDTFPYLILIYRGSLI